MLLTQFLVVVLVRGCFFLVFVRSYCYCLVLFVVVCFARCPLPLVFVSQLDLVLCSQLLVVVFVVCNGFWDGRRFYG